MATGTLSRRICIGSCITVALAALVPGCGAESGVGGRSAWWSGEVGISQDYGCTDVPGEPNKGHHPECPSARPGWHAGIDFPLKAGTPLFAAVGATVISRGDPAESSYFGSSWLRLRLDDGHDVILAHVRKAFVSAGARVSPGQTIAEVGSEGYSIGPHLHFEVRPAGGAYFSDVDPRPFVNLGPGDGGGRGRPPSSGWSCDHSSYQGKQYWTCSGGSLHRCDNGVAKEQTCERGCYEMSVGRDDLCINSTSGWSCRSSSYQGKQLWTCGFGGLYRCDDSGPTVVHCPADCQRNPEGTADACR